MLKRALKWVSGLAVVYAGIGFLGVPYVIKNIAPQKIEEATQGGKFSVEKASFNPFTFNLKLKKAVFKTPEGGDLISFKSFSFNLDPVAYVWKGGWVISGIELVEPKVTIRRGDDGEFNFGWLTKLGGEEKTNEEASTPPKLIIKKATLRDGQVFYRDFADNKSYELDIGPAGFHIENIDMRDLSNEDGIIRFYAMINDGGFVDLKGKIDSLKPLRIGGSVAFSSGKLYTPWRYFKDKFPIEVADGEARFGFHYRFDSSDINATELSSLYAQIDKLRLISKEDEKNLLNVSRIGLKEGRVLPLKKRFEAGSFSISGVDVAAERNRAGVINWMDYMSQIQKAFPSDKNETTEPWSYAIGSFSLDSLKLRWHDEAPKEPYALQMEGISIGTGLIESDEAKPITAAFRTGKIRFERESDHVSPAGLESFSLDEMRIGRQDRSIQIGSIGVRTPYISLKRNKNGTLDISDYLYSDPKAQSPAKSKDEEKGWGYQILQTVLENGKADIIDEVPVRRVSVGLDEIGLRLENITDNPATPIGIELSSLINKSGSLHTKGEVSRVPLKSRGSFDIANVDLSVIDPYIEPSSYASLKRGKVTLKGDYTYDAPKASVKGKVALSDWVVNDSRDDSVLLGWQEIGATPFTYAYPDNRLKINQLVVDGLYTNALIDKNKVLNYTTLSKAAPSESKAAKPSSGNPFGLDVVKLVVRGSSASFSDLSLPLPFKSYIHDLEGSVLGISTTKDVTTFVKLRGGVDQYGLAKIDGSLNTKDPKKFTDMKVAFDNLDLQHYTPYSLEFLGYKIDGGKLFLNLGYKIDGGALKGDNGVVIRQIELGAEKEGGSPWPMKLVVALLEDSDGVIDISLPVEGDVNNPDFRYGAVVWQVIKNLFTKAVTAPFRLLGSMMGIDDDSLSTVDFESGSSVLLPPQIEKLDKLAQVLTKRPKLTLSVSGAYDTVADGDAIRADKIVAMARQKEPKLKFDSPNAISVDLLEDMMDDADLKKERKALAEELKNTYKEEAEYVRHYSAEMVRRLKAKQTVLQTEYDALALKRAQAVQNYLIKAGIPQTRLMQKGNVTVKSKEDETVPSKLEVAVP